LAAWGGQGAGTASRLERRRLKHRTVVLSKDRFGSAFKFGSAFSLPDAAPVPTRPRVFPHGCDGIIIAYLPRIVNKA